MGIGKEMRFAVLTFAFEHLGANAITSGAFEDNAASRAVSLATGYEPDGIEEKLRRGVLSRHLRYRLSSERWSASSGGLPVVVEGLDECRPMLGLN